MNERFARMRLVDGDDLFDRPGPRREHRHAIGQEHGLAETVRDEDDGLVRSRQQHRKIFAEHHARLLVERAERLVHQKNVGLQAECARERGALAHAARQLGRIMLGKVEKADSLQCAAGARTALGLGDALERHPEHDVLKHRIPWKQRAFLKHESEIVRHRAAHRLARDRDRAGRRRKQSAHDAEQR